MKQILLLFIDGIGIAPPSPGNPITHADYPALASILESAHPIDAGLNVPGLPQSATGQATMLTGLNASEAVGRHVEGFPGPQLQQLITRHNVLRKLHEHGKAVTFANAYTMSSIDDVRAYRFRSVTTTCVLSCPSALRLLADLRANNAVYQDITRHLLRERDIDIPTISPDIAAKHLAAITTAHDLTLFEYFQTDRAGHRGDADRVRNILTSLEHFCAALLPALDASQCTLAITSDHGNIEDLTRRSHTANPVPWYTQGPLAPLLTNTHSLLDVTPSLLNASLHPLVTRD